MKIEDKNNIIRGIIGFLLYFILSFNSKLPLELLHIDYANMSMTIKQIYLFLYNFLTVLVIVLLYIKDLKKEFIDFKNNYQKYFKENIKYWFIALAVMYVSNFVIAMIKYQTTGEITSSENENTIRETLMLAPVYTFVSASLFAPILEELTFRKSLRKIFSNKVLFIIISSLIFGSLHVITNNFTTLDLLYLILYCAPGVAFAYILVKTDNIFNTMSLHLLHNTILMILQLILLSKGLL